LSVDKFSIYCDSYNKGGKDKDASKHLGRRYGSKLVTVARTAGHIFSATCINAATGKKAYSFVSVAKRTT